MQLLLKRLKDRGHTIIVWTGDTKEYAQQVVKDLNLGNYVDQCRTKLGDKDQEMPDIAFDDNEVACFLAKESTILV